MNKIRSLFRVFFNLMICAALLSCANTVPSISSLQSSIHLNYDPRTKTYERFLSVYFQIQDGDGDADVDNCYILSDQRELIWWLPRSEWQTLQSDAKTWYGFSRLTFPYAEPGARGPLRILVEDRAGHQSELGFAIPLEPGFDESKTPKLTKAKDFLRIEPRAQPERFRRFLLAWDGTGSERFKTEISDNQFLLKDLPPELIISDLKWQVIDYYNGGELVFSSGLW